MRQRVLPNWLLAGVALTCACAKPQVAWEKPGDVANAGMVFDAELGAVVFIDSQGALRALEAGTGNERWTFRAATGRLYPPLATDASRVYAHRLGGVEAVDGSSGRSAWTYPSRYSLSAPAAASGRVVFGEGWDLRVVDAATGAASAELQVRQDRYPSSLCLEKGVAYFGYRQDQAFVVFIGGKSVAVGGACAAELDSGRLLWCALKHPPSERLLLAEEAVVAVELSAGARHAVGLDRASGKELWRRAGVAGSPGAEGGLVFVASWGTPSYDGKLVALDSASGEERWSYPFEAKPVNRNDLTGPIAVGDAVVLAVNQVLHAADRRTGKPRWAFKLPDTVVALAAGAGKDLYVADAGGRLRKLRLP